MRGLGGGSVDLKLRYTKKPRERGNVWSAKAGRHPST